MEPINVRISIIIVRIKKKNTSIWQRPHFCCFRDSLRYVICPQKSSKPSSRLACNYDISCCRPETIIFVNGLKLSFCDVMPSKMQFISFITNRIFMISLMSCTITIFESKNTIVPELILRTVWENAFALSPCIRVFCRTTQISPTSS